MWVRLNPAIVFMESSTKAASEELTLRVRESQELEYVRNAMQ